MIEWRHLDVKGETCNRCYDTGENIKQEVERLNRAFEPKGIYVDLVETKLDEKQVGQSNALLFNGVPIEEVLEIEVHENYCASCSTLLGSETYCRTIIFEGEEYDDVPLKAIRKAAYKVLGINEEKVENTDSCGCGCGCKCC